MEARRLRVLLIGQQLVQFRLLRGRRAEGQHHVLQPHRRIHRAAVRFQTGQAVQIALHRTGHAGIDGLADSVGGGGGRERSKYEGDP